MAALLDVVGAPTAVIGGLSLGGYMSLAFNVAYPGRVRALMLFDTGPGYRSDSGRDGWIGLRRSARRIWNRMGWQRWALAVR